MSPSSSAPKTVEVKTADKKVEVKAAAPAAPKDKKALAQINPYHPTGLEPPPPDYQYNVPHQMKKPLIFENRVDANDLRNIHNPGKYDHTLGEYAQVSEPTNKAVPPTASATVKTAVKEAPQLKKEKVVPVAAS